MSHNINSNIVLLIGTGSMAVAYAKVLQGQKIDFQVVGRGVASAQTFYEETGNIYIVVNGVKFNANLRDFIYQKDSRGISGGEIRIDNMGIDVSLGMRYEEYKRYLFTRYFFSVQEGDKNFFTQKEETIRGGEQ